MASQFAIITDTVDNRRNENDVTNGHKRIQGARRRAYASSDRAKLIRILDEVCETTGYERKYANRLLTGSRKFHERRGRGRAYGEDVAETLRKVWTEAGCPCLPYFKAESER